MQHFIMVYKMLQRIQQPLLETTGQTRSLRDKFIFWFFYVHYTTHGTNGFTSHPIEAMVKCLA